jgi:ABC-type antimicrobial peptide transport system permease subunit
VAVGSVWLTLRAGFRGEWRGWLALALLLGVMSGVVLAAAAGARRTDTAYPRLLTWSRASDLQVIPYGNGVPGYYQALGRLPQVAAMSTADLMNMTVRLRGGYVPAAQFQVYASPDGRMGISVDRVKVLAGRLFDPADPRAIMIDQKLADEEHARPGSTVRLLGVPNDQNGNPDLARAIPLAFRVSAIVVFDNQIAPVATGGNTTALLSPAFLRTAAGRQVPNSGYEAFVRLRPGASPAGFLQTASVLAARYPAVGGKILGISTADEVTATQRAIRPYAVALALFAALAGVIALVIIGQLLGRQLVLDSAWFGVLRALGMTRGRLAALSLARVGAVSAAGGCLAVAIAVAASPLMPIGPARLAEPAPGIEVNVAILVAGFVVIALAPLAVAAPVAWRAAAGQPARLTEPSVPQRPSRLGTALGVAGTVTGGIGVRMAFERGHGRTAVPVRPALAAITVATAAVTAAAVFGSSLIALVSTPHRYGQNWTRELDLAFGAGSQRLLARIVSAQSGVTGYADGNYGQVTIQGQTIAAIGVTPLRGQSYLTLLAGHLPSGPGQIALGAQTLRSLHRQLGQTVQVTANGYGVVVTHTTGPLRIVGEVIFASLGRRGGFTGTDLGNGALVSTSLLSIPFPQTGCTTTCYNFILLRYRPGTSPAAAAARLIAAVTRLGCPPGSCSVAGDQRPLDIQGYTGIRDTPLILGALLTLLGVAALAHVLVTGVRRRRRDLAILKIIGMRKAQLLSVVCWQAVALTAAALIAGIPLGILVGRWSWALFAGSVGVAPSAQVPLLLLLTETAAALLVGIITATIPGRTAARTRPATVLRTE